MRIVPLPGTDLNVSAVTFGCGDTARLMVTGETSDQVRVIEGALDLGVTHFDTSAVYGHGASEVNLGRALGSRRHDVVLSSKAYVTPEHLQADAVAVGIRRSVESSLLRLRRDVIDILLLHNPVAPEREFFPSHLPRAVVPGISHEDFEQVREAVEGLKRDGKIRHFGIAAANSTYAETTRKLIEAGEIAVFNQQYNLMNPSPGWPDIGKSPVAARLPGFRDYRGIIGFAASRGVGCLAIVPLGAGALIGGTHAVDGAVQSARFLQAGEFEAQRALAAQFEDFATQRGMSLRELAYRFVLSDPGVATVVGGFSCLEHVEEAATFAGRGAISEDFRKDIQRMWSDEIYA